MQAQLIALFPITLIVTAGIIFLAYKNRRYKKGAYYQITKNPYSSVKYDKGKYAEYLTYESLRHFENNGGRFLFNVLIPKGDGKTTEIDVLLICVKGLFVFECKNYSGWIFGNETHKNWTQTLPKGYQGDCHKEQFYNPVMQNASHIRHLKNLIGSNIPMRSVIVFSDRCILMDVTIKSDDVSVINRRNVASVIGQLCDQIQNDIYTETEINDIYNKLFPYTQFGCEIKERHAQNIRKDFV